MVSRKILLIDDDRVQFVVTQALIEGFGGDGYILEWVPTYESGIERLLSGAYEICLLDYQLGQRDGLELIRDATARGCRTPIIFLTAESSAAVDIEAMEAGALDYLIKGEITPGMLGRSLRYALKLGNSLEQLRLLATRDELTGLMNRRAFDGWLGEEIVRSRRFSRPVGLVLLDLDHFKSINDRYGHPAGDAVLREMARRVAETIRTVDRAIRYGGEEFAVIATEADGPGALETARRLVAAASASPVRLPDGREITVSLSAGAAAFPNDAGDSASLIEAADLALYLAKRSGRNRAVAHDPGLRSSLPFPAESG